MLDQITNDIWSSAEFQRGTVNYLKAYDKAWTRYMDLAEGMAADSDMLHHPLFQSGAFRNRKAPGIYQNGGLVRAPSTFIGNRPTSAYGAAKFRKRAGKSQNPDRDFVKKEETRVRGGYEKVWRQNFRKRYPGRSQVEEDAYMKKQVDNSLRKRGVTQEQIEASRVPAPDVLRLPTEANRKTPKDYVNAHENIDARDREAVVGQLVKKLDLKSEVSSLEDFQKQVSLHEVTLGSEGAGMPQILQFSTKGRISRNDVSGIRSGLTYVDRVGKGEYEKPNVHVLEFSKVDHMLETLAQPPLRGLMETDVFSEKQWQVLNALDDLKDAGNDMHRAETYLLLIRDCQRKSMGGSTLSEFALDQIREMYDLMPRIEATPARLKKLFVGADTIDKTYLTSIQDDRITKNAFHEFVERHPKQKAIARALLKTYFNDNAGFDAFFDTLAGDG